MKTFLVLIILSVFFAATTHADADAGYTPESRSSSEIFTSKVIKIYSFQDNEADYVAYVVTWKDHEVVVAPLGTSGSDKHYNVGDTVKCQMLQMSHRVGDSAKTRVTFSLIPNGGPGASDEIQRLEAVRAEVEARRLRRTPTEATPQSKTP